MALRTKKVRVTASVDGTRKFGKEVANKIGLGDNIFLKGDLGTGKTAFIQGLAEGLGIHEPIKSPTYTYLREYALPRDDDPTPELDSLNDGEGRLAHFDLYRLPDKPALSELDSIELPERIKDPFIITAVEWAEKLGQDYLDNNATLIIEFSIPEGREFTRKIEVTHA